MKLKIMKRNFEIGFITIGQSPRRDIFGDMQECLQGISYTEVGALDGFSMEQIEKLKLHYDDKEPFYVTRLNTGTEIMVAERTICGLIQEKARILLKRGTKHVILACTGEFPSIPKDIDLHVGAEILKDKVKMEYRGKKIALVIPNINQTVLSKRWSEIGIENEPIACQPYNVTSETVLIANRIKKDAFDFILLDCMGYTKQIASCFQEITSKKVILARETICEAAVLYSRTN